MITRTLLAVVGASIITIGLLLAMDQVTSVFRERSGERFFRISDILPRPDRGRPERPEPVARQPEWVAPELPDLDVSLPVEPLDEPDIEAITREAARPGEAAPANDRSPTSEAAPATDAAPLNGAAPE